ncbi:MAG: DUF721 domain-containing protein [Pseudomonadota bacterium]
MAGPSPYRRTGKGFRKTGTLLETRIRKAGESRGFAVSRLLTHWTEIVGPDIAANARPVNVSYAKGGFGATLVLLTTSARAPMLQMQVETIREKVNACYGYNAISRVRITQTAPTGFAEGQVAFAPAPSPEVKPDPVARAKATDLAAGTKNDELRAALSALGENILKSSKGN